MATKIKSDPHLAIARILFSVRWKLPVRGAATKILPSNSLPLLSAVRATSGQLKLLPFCDPPRGDPRFDKIVASLAPKETEK
jgi:hypothetical protein